MAVRVVKLGSDRLEGEGLRIGTVRRPPRGVPKTEFSSQNWYDVWFPNLSPSPDTMKMGQAAKTEKEWRAFKKKYRAEMATPENGRTLDLLAALSHQTDFSVGCYCEDEARCHRSVLKELLMEKGARIGEGGPDRRRGMITAVTPGRVQDGAAAHPHRTIIQTGRPHEQALCRGK